MREVQLYIAPSLDGYIAGPEESLDWLFHEEDGVDYGYQRFLDQIDTLIMGRRTWEVSRDLAEWAYSDKKSYVFSSQKLEITEPSVEQTGLSPAELVKELKRQPGKNIWLFGGGALTRCLLREALVDRLFLYVHPVLLGGGIPLFPEGFPRAQLNLLATKTYENGLVQLDYSFKQEPSRAPV